MKINNEKGFSLASVMVAAGLLGMLAMGTMRLMENQAQVSANYTTTFEVNSILTQLNTVLLNSEACLNTLPSADLRSNTTVDGVYNRSGVSIFNTTDKYGNNAVKFKSFSIVKASDHSSDIESAFTPHPIPSGSSAYGEIALKVEIEKLKKKALGGSSMIKYIPLKIEVDENYVPKSCYSATENAVETAKSEMCSDLGGQYSDGSCQLTGGNTYGTVLKEAACEMLGGTLNASGVCSQVHASEFFQAPELHLETASFDPNAVCSTKGIVRYNTNTLVDGPEYCDGEKFVKMKTTAISQACEVVRGGSTQNDSILYCPEDKPMVFSCNAIDNQAPDDGPTNMSSRCPSSGACSMNSLRTDLGSDGFYLETVTNGTTQGCLAYDDNHSHTSYRIEITCCESIE